MQWAALRQVHSARAGSGDGRSDSAAKCERPRKGREEVVRWESIQFVPQKTNEFIHLSQEPNYYISRYRSTY
jgi:hypothetical protein